MTTLQPMETDTLCGLKRSFEDAGETNLSPTDQDEPRNTTDNECVQLNNEHDPHIYDYTSLPVYGLHKRAVSCVSFAPTISSASMCTPSGQVICASGSADGSVRLWDISKDLSLASVDATADIKTKLTAEQPHQDLTNQMNPVVTVTGHVKGINDLAWSPRALNLMVTASDDKTCKLWDVTRSTGSATETSSVLAGKPSISATSSENNHIHHPLVDFKGHSNFCFSVKFNPQGNLIVTGSFDETVKLWDVRTGDCISTLPAHSDPVTAVDFNRDGTCIVSSSHDGLMRIWDVATGECLKTIYAEKNPPVTFVKYAPNGKYVLSGMLDGKLRLWDVMGRFDTTSHMDLHGLLSTNTGSMDTDSSILLDRTLTQMIAGRGGQCTKTYSGHVNSKYCIFSTFSVANPNRQRIVSGSEDGKVYIYDLQTRKIKQRLDAHTDACLAVAAHDTKEILASGGMCKDKMVKFWVPKGG